MRPKGTPQMDPCEGRRNLYACLFTWCFLLLAVSLGALMLSAAVWVAAKAWALFTGAP